MNRDEILKKNLDLHAEWKQYAMQHEITPQEAKDVHQWLVKVYEN